MKRNEILITIWILSFIANRVTCYRVIIDFKEVETRLNNSNLNVLLMISQYNNCPMCLSVEKNIKSIDSYAKHYMSLYILHCDMIPKNMLKSNSTSPVLKLIKKKCFKRLTMIKPEVVLFSPVRVQLESNTTHNYPTRFSTYSGNFSVDELVEFIFKYSSSFAEEVKSSTRLNQLLIQNEIPIVFSFSDSSRPSLFVGGLSTYFWKKIKFVWVSQSNEKIHKEFLSPSHKLPTFHLIYQGNLSNFTSELNFTNILSFIQKFTGIQLPNPENVVSANSYQFFSDICSDCTSLLLDNPIQLLQKENYPLRAPPIPFWDFSKLNDHASPISRETIKLMFPSEMISSQESQRDGVRAHLIKNSFFNEYYDVQRQVNEGLQQQNQSQETKVYNRFTLFRGYEIFDKWEELKEKVETDQQIFEFNEVDCRSQECTIWARNTFNTLFIPFVLFESDRIRGSPILIDNSKEIMQIYQLISEYISLSQPENILHMDSDKAIQFCNVEMKRQFLCVIFLGESMRVQFQVLSQSVFTRSYFIQIIEPSDQLLAKLNAEKDSFYIINNKAHLEFSSHFFPLHDRVQHYVDLVRKNEAMVGYEYHTLTNINDILADKSLIQVVIQCIGSNECKRIPNVLKTALKSLNYLDYASIYIDQFNTLIPNEERCELDQIRIVYLILESEYFTIIHAKSYTHLKELSLQVKRVEDQLIAALSYYHTFTKLI